MRHILVLIILAVFTLKPQAFAQKKGGGGGKSGVYLETTLFPEIVNENDTSSYTDAPGAAVENGSGFNTKTTLGYVFAGSWLVGATYNMDTLSTSRSNRVGGDSGLKEKKDSNQLGATIGYLTGGWRFLFTGILSGEKVVDTKNMDNTGITGNKKITNTEASGAQVVVGYSYPVTGTFAIGPALTYRSVTYSKQSKVNRLNATENYDDVSLYTDATESDLDLMFSMVFVF